MRLLIAAGGTAGHINPGLAVADKIMEEYPGSEVQFVGTEEGLETNLVPRAGYKLNFIKIHGFDRSVSLQNLKNICELPLAIHSAAKIIKEFRPDIVIGTGGYVSGPVLYAAAKRKIPTLVHESNAFPGVTTRILAEYVDTVALGVEDAKNYLKKPKRLLVTGTPVRGDLLKVDEFEARRILKLDERPYIVIFGGSLGAVAFNKTVVDWICRDGINEKYQMLMGTGKFNRYNDVINRFKENNVDIEAYDNIKVCEYIYDMNVVMAAADIVVSRAGASTLCELTALGKAAILVPSPYVTGNHQEHNARALQRGGGAEVILESDFTAGALQKAIEELTLDKNKLVGMKQASKKMGHIDALEVLCREIKRLAG